ncbi:hypothetical protein NT6N_16300 [Oceaniferula spumae]|uniref:Knr4/Smi1-like domain-containing protein n=1 Tax=Oceaniferula spumae TaxID=2979115 RepID=A0AAT9FKT8_9BACT
MNIFTQWEQLEAWLSDNAPPLLEGLRPGATPTAIAEAEASLGVKFPEDFRTCYLIHDGQDPDTPWLFDASEFLSLERIVEEWTVWKDLLDGGDFTDCESTPDTGVKPDWWNASWIPFTYNGSGDHLCIDLDPTNDGTQGQVIEMWHDMDNRPVVAKSFSEWFSGLVGGVLSGDYVLSEEYDGLIHKDNL